MLQVEAHADDGAGDVLGTLALGLHGLVVIERLRRVRGLLVLLLDVWLAAAQLRTGVEQVHLLASRPPRRLSDRHQGAAAAHPLAQSSHGVVVERVGVRALRKHQHVDLVEVEAPERRHSNRTHREPEAAFEDIPRPPCRQARCWCVPCEHHARRLQRGDVTGAQRDAAVDPAAVEGDQGHAVSPDDAGQRLALARGQFRDTDDCGACRVGPRADGEASASLMHADPRSQQCVDSARRVAAPRQQVGHLGRRQGGRHSRGGRADRRRGGRQRLRARDDLDVEQRRQAPAGDVIDLIAEPLLATAILLLHERFRLGDVRVEQVAHETARRLGRRDQIGPRRHVARADLECLAGHPHVNPLPGKVAREAAGHSRIVAGQQDVLAGRGSFALGDGRAAVLEEVAEQALAVGGRRVGGRDGRVEVVHDSLAVGEGRVVVAREDQAAGRCLFVRHPDRAVEDRPRLAVPGIERVVDLADEVREAAIVEARGVGAAKRLEPADLVRGDERVERIGRRREVVRRVAAHLVQVHDDVREVVQRDLQAAQRFRLGLREPVAVHVEQVVIRPAAGPRLVVFGAEAIAVGRGGASKLVLEKKPRTAVRVLERIDQHDRLAEDRVDHRIPTGRQQVVGLGKRGVRRRDLVAVDGVHQPSHHRQLTRQPRLIGARQRARVGQALEIRLDLVEAADPCRRRDGQHV